MAYESFDPKQKVMPESDYKPSDKEIELVSEVYSDFYLWRSYRSGRIRQLQNHSLEDYLSISRELFWNSAVTSSEDLQELGLDFQIGFIRKESLDFLGRLIALNIKPRPTGEGLNTFGVKVLEAMYKKWRMKSNDKVEKFWQLLYAIVNGTLVNYVGYNNTTVKRDFLREYDSKAGTYKIDTKDVAKWNDVWEEICPLEDIYVPKIWERNMQKQGKIIWKSQMELADFKTEFKQYPNAKYVLPGNRIAEDSLYYQLLGGTGVTTTTKVEVLKYYDETNDRQLFLASGIWLNPLGKRVAPLSMNHKMLPFVKGEFEPIDEKFFYGMSLPFKLKDPHKILNTSYAMLVERELRAISPPIISSDIESPDIIYGQNKVIPVNDVNAYKEFTLAEPSPQFFTMTNALQGIINTHAQGGFQQIAPSRQPRSAREVLAMEGLKNSYMANTLLLYYNILRQEILMVLKTALQFYTADKYKKNISRIIRAISVPNMALTAGGIGTMEIRVVTEKQADLLSFMESLHKSVVNGKLTEIIEAPADLIENLEFEISDIELEQEQTSEMEQATFIDKVLTPMVQLYMPAGLVDVGKLYLRHMEKIGEHPADYTPDRILPQLMQMWGQEYKMPEGAMMQTGNAVGNMMQSQRGTQFGGTGGQGGVPAIPFGSPKSQPLPTEGI